MLINMLKTTMLMGTLFLPNVVAGNEFFGTLHSIETPSQVVVELNSGNLLRLNIIGPDFGANAGVSCEISTEAREKCHVLEDYISDKHIGVIVEETDGQVMFGDLVIESTPLSLMLVRQGHYRVDFAHNRSHPMIEAEAEARCHYRGIWEKHRGDYQIAKSCAGW